MEINKKLLLSGLVQGVGFRPFVYKLAHRFDLKGYVLNNDHGAQAEIEGSSRKIDAFLKALFDELPPLARIDSITSQEGIKKEFKEFKIVESEHNTYKTALISPDISLCAKCHEEMQDPKNRRYKYPFINCTDCGPRYSIIDTVPYDRPNTSMRFFKMCKQCEREYSDPIDRRFHAQPISCFDCGPTLSLLDMDANILANDSQAIQIAIKAVLDGKIIAIKGVGGFHLICDASNSTAVSLLRKRKKRPAKPFAIMFSNIDELKDSADISAEEEVLLTSMQKPIVITSKSKNSAICEEVSPQLDRIGVFLAYTPLHQLLLQDIKRPVVATSANLRDEPIIRDSHTLIQKLGDVVDLVLDNDREIINTNDDSVMQIVAGKSVFLRMARGFSPKSIRLPFKSKKNILAVGANQKNNITLIFGDKLIVSPYIGDLNSMEAFEYFERTVETFKRIYDFRVEVIVCDKHPQYETTKWAKALKAKDSSLSIIEVQHHYAHILAVKAEHGLHGKVLGFAFDGTGYGDDGTIWGTEVMIADEHEYKRICSLKPFRLLGAEKAVKEPRRNALSLLFTYFSLDEILYLELSVLNEYSNSQLQMLHKAWQKGLNSPYTSSMGRLFDAIASLADIIHVLSFEGESGLKMENYVDPAVTQSFEFSIKDGVIDPELMIREIVTMKENKIKIVSMFFNTLIEIIVDISTLHPELPLLFSGGVFQNRVLLEKIVKRFEKIDKKVYFQQETAINDGGISLGQAWFALHNQ